MKIAGVSLNIGRAMTGSGLVFHYNPEVPEIFGSEPQPMLTNGHWMLFGPSLLTRKAAPHSGCISACKALEAAIRKAGAVATRGSWRFDTLTSNGERLSAPDTLSPADIEQVLPPDGIYHEIDLFEVVLHGTDMMHMKVNLCSSRCEVQSLLCRQIDPVPLPNPPESRHWGGVWPEPIGLMTSYVLGLKEMGAKLWARDREDNLTPLMISDHNVTSVVGALMPSRLD